VTSSPTDPQDADVYDSRAYWSALHRRGGLKAVGQSGLPEGFNRWLYKIGRGNVVRFLDAHGCGDLSDLAVLDVGSGTGFWIDVWRSMGAARIDGVELIAEAVDRLRERHPDSTFTLGDVADPGLVLRTEPYDAVMIMNVLLHVVEDDRFATAASKLAAAVRPGGRLLLAEPALRRPTSFRPPKPGAASLARPLSRYREVFEAGGLRMIAVGASTVVGANPIEAGDPLYRWYAALWKRVGRSARRGPRRANVLGGFLAALDRVLMATGAAPSGKLILFERPAIPKVP
jgi:2-polyprenyl-3-methyl-5-hydroxy-6-metoxy-1,4-benzoquinol methylase